MRKQSLLGTPLGTESILGDMKTNQPTTKLNSIEEVLREFREKFLTPIKLKYVPDAIVFGIRPERDQIAIEAFIRAALTKIQSETREETIKTVKEVKKEAAYKSTEVLFDKVIGRLKEER